MAIKEFTSYIISLFLTLAMVFILPSSAFLESRLLVLAVFIVFTVIYLLFIPEKGKRLIQTYYSNPIIISLTIFALINLSYILVTTTFSMDFFLKSILAFILPLAFLLTKNEPGKFQATDIIVLIIALVAVALKLANLKLIGYQDTIAFNLGYSFIILYLLFVFIGYRKLDLGLNFKINFAMFRETVVLSLALIFIDILIGVNLKFISFPQNLNIDYKNLILYGIFMLFFATFAEELFFRGLLFNYLRQFTGKHGDLIALLISSVIFGVSHLFKFNLSMFVLATFAGIFYGLVYLRTRNLMCAALIHTLTNLCWKLFFVTK